MDQAIGSFRRAASLNPNLSKAHCKLGNALQSTGQIDQAIAEFRHALILNPNLVEAHNNLAIALQEDGRAGEAIAAARLAISLDPHLAEAHYNLGNALKANGQSDAAIAAYRRALALNPDLAEAHHNLGIACRSIGQIDEAIAAYRRALALNRGLAEAHNSLGLALLLQGEFLPGWDEYEWRWKMKDFPSPERNFDQAQWNGQPLEGRTLLLHAEQGIGDTLQFIRYLPPIRRLGASIIVECPSELQRLIRPIASGHRVVATGQPLPPFELHCPLMSLPRVFGTTLDSIPREIPYLHADADDIQTWKDRLGEDLPSLKVGLAWAGSPNHAEDRYRSIALDRLGPLGQVPGIRFVSLQRGHAATQTNKLPHGMQLIDISEEINDFADTAALIANLDLVIAVDTAVAHLAGAMGAPVWVLLPFAPDWRWMLDREDSPWYPTMRLFRQPLRGDWDSVVARIVCALSIWTKSHARTKSSPMSFQHCLPPEGAEVGRNQTYRGAGII
jgi:Flp pilus assembly protein TadD